MNNYIPPFKITEKMTLLIGEISEEIGRISVFHEKVTNPHLRRENRIKTIHSSLAIEHNSLSLEQVTAILNGKRILGNPNEIKEVKNAYEAYELLTKLNPFSDGNGRMGRMWHTLLLGKWKKIFFWLPIEELIKKRQKEYYDSLALSDKDGESTVFVEFMLKIIKDSLLEMEIDKNLTDQVNDQDTDQDKNFIEKLLFVLGDNTLSAMEIMKKLNLSHKPTFRKNYLNSALESKIIERTIPDKPNSKNQKYRKIKK